MVNNIIAVTNQKGGVGKTTTVVNLATALAVAEKKVLVIDFDSQGNTTTAFSNNKNVKYIYTIYDLLKGKVGVNRIIYNTFIKNLSIIPSDINLAAFEVDFIGEKNREFILATKLKGKINQYDYILIDCPPALGLLNINALCMADSVIIPLQCEFYSLEGISKLLKTLARIKANFNNSLKIKGVLLTMHDARNRLTHEVEKDVRSFLQNKVFATVIPRNVKLGEAPSFGLPAIIYDPKSSGATAYINFSKELLNRDKNG